MSRRIALYALSAVGLAAGSLLGLVCAAGRALANRQDLNDIFDTRQD